MKPRTADRSRQEQSIRSAHTLPTTEPDLRELARSQGVPLAADFDALIGDVWPEDESIDDFLATLKRWRREEGVLT